MSGKSPKKQLRRRYYSEDFKREAELREESWREISSESAPKEVDKRVSKKL